MLSLLVLGVLQSPSSRVLVVVNDKSAESREVGEYYVSKRGIPATNVLRISTATHDEIDWAEYEKAILNPVTAKLGQLKKPIDYVVLTTRVPLRIVDSSGCSVDSTLAALKFANGRKKDPAPLMNPYHKKEEPFSNEKHGLYLVTRLDGYTVADCKKLVDNSLKAKTQKGLFVLDGTPTKDGAIGQMNENLKRTAQKLEQGGKTVQWDNAPPFLKPSGPVMAYLSWGSNDWNFNVSIWKDMKFHPGAISETFVSTSARTFRPTTGGQSLIADLIAAGVTGVKGYVSEPYLSACAKPDILIDRYFKGRNLAESFYAASPMVKWKDVVIGDPLARL